MGSSQSSEREPEPSKVIETDEKLQEKPERVDDDDEPDEWWVQFYFVYLGLSNWPSANICVGTNEYSAPGAQVRSFS